MMLLGIPLAILAIAIVVFFLTLFVGHNRSRAWKQRRSCNLVDFKILEFFWLDS